MINDEDEKESATSAHYLLWAFMVWAQEPAQQPSDQSPASGASSDAATASTVRGCLNGSEGNYVLVQDNGTSLKLTGNTAGLKDHVGHQVQITGQMTPTTGGSSPGENAENMLQVSEVTMISDNCGSGSGAGSSSAAESGASNASDTRGGSSPAGANAASPDASTANSGSSDSTNSAANATAPPAGSTSASQYGNESMTTSSSAPRGTDPAATSAPDSSAGQATSPDQAGVPNASSQEGQGAAQAQAGDADQAANSGENLPQTASDLPLLAALALGLVIAGTVITSRRKARKNTSLFGLER
jgi:hypothetical protein